MRTGVKLLGRLAGSRSLLYNRESEMPLYYCQRRSNSLEGRKTIVAIAPVSTLVLLYILALPYCLPNHMITYPTKSVGNACNPRKQ